MPQDGDFFFPNLEVRNLNYNKVTQFMPGTFNQLGQHLDQLKLSSNHITEIHVSTLRVLY